MAQARMNPAALGLSRRPGIEALLARLRAQHPDWPDSQILATAKSMYSSPLIARQTHAGGCLELVANPDYQGGQR